MKENKSHTIDQELRKAYELAVYRLFDPPISFKIACKNAPLGKLLAQHNAQNAFFISAFNPQSVILTSKENLYRHQLLKKQLEQDKYIIYEGIGEDENGQWPGELSWLVLSMTQEEAVKVARAFNQLAVLSLDKNGFARLVWC